MAEVISVGNRLKRKVEIPRIPLDDEDTLDSEILYGEIQLRKVAKRQIEELDEISELDSLLNGDSNMEIVSSNSMDAYDLDDKEDEKKEEEKKDKVSEKLLELVTDNIPEGKQEETKPTGEPAITESEPDKLPDGAFYVEGRTMMLSHESDGFSVIRFRGVHLESLNTVNPVKREKAKKTKKGEGESVTKEEDTKKDVPKYETFFISGSNCNELSSPLLRFILAIKPDEKNPKFFNLLKIHSVEHFYNKVTFGVIKKAVKQSYYFGYNPDIDKDKLKTSTSMNQFRAAFHSVESGLKGRTDINLKPDDIELTESFLSNMTNIEAIKVCKNIFKKDSYWHAVNMIGSLGVKSLSSEEITSLVNGNSDNQTAILSKVFFSTSLTEEAKNYITRGDPAYERIYKASLVYHKFIGVTKYGHSCMFKTKDEDWEDIMDILQKNQGPLSYSILRSPKSGTYYIQSRQTTELQNGIADILTKSLHNIIVVKATDDDTMSDTSPTSYFQVIRELVKEHKTKLIITSDRRKYFISSSIKDVTVKTAIDFIQEKKVSYQSTNIGMFYPSVLIERSHEFTLENLNAVLSKLQKACHTKTFILAGNPHCSSLERSNPFQCISLASEGKWRTITCLSHRTGINQRKVSAFEGEVGKVIIAANKIRKNNVCSIVSASSYNRDYIVNYLNAKNIGKNFRFFKPFEIGAYVDHMVIVLNGLTKREFFNILNSSNVNDKSLVLMGTDDDLNAVLGDEPKPYMSSLPFLLNANKDSDAHLKYD